MKKTLIILLCIFASLNTNAQWQDKHRGLDLRIHGMYSYSLKYESSAFIGDIGLGKRISKDFYAGIVVGMMKDLSNESSDPIIPICIEQDWYFGSKRCAFTLGSRVGFGLNTAADIQIAGETIKMPNYLILEVLPGMTFAINRGIDLNLKAGLMGMQSVGGSGESVTDVSVVVGAGLVLHKNTFKREKQPTRERGMQYSLEGFKTGFNGDYDTGGFALAMTYKFSHNLFAGIGFGMDIMDIELDKPIYQFDMNKNKYVFHDYLGNRLTGAFKLFVRGQYNFWGHKRFSPFVACDAGLRFYTYSEGTRGFIPEEEDRAKVANMLDGAPSLAFYIDPAIGVTLRTTNNSYLDLKVGCTLAPGIESQQATKIEDGVFSAARYRGRCMSNIFVGLGFRHTLKWGSKWGK